MTQSNTHNERKQQLEAVLMQTDGVCSVSVNDDEKGLCIKVSNANANATISLFGGHVLSYIPASSNKDVLWLSSQAIFDSKSPIRGGIPVCWPWFAAYNSSNFDNALANTNNLPSHGFLRTQFWQLLELKETQEHNKVVETILRLRPTNIDVYDAYKDMDVILELTIGSDLTVSLISQNKGEENIQITQALHTYFQVDNVQSTIVEGVSENYDDKPSATKNNTTALPYVFQEEVDRIHYLNNAKANTAQVIHLVDHKHSMRQQIENYGNDSVVVWNPWQEKSVSMNDMADDGYCSMVCIEAANTKATTISPGETFTLTQLVKGQ